MRKRTQKAVDDMSPQVQSELVRPYKSPSYEAHEYYQVPPPGIEPWPTPVFPPIPLPSFKIPTPIFAPSPGVWPSTQKLSILGMSGADIYYTLNGTVPNEHSHKYIVPMSIIFDSTYKAKAFKEGWTPSNIATALYTSSDSWSFVSNLNPGVPADIYDYHHLEAMIYLPGINAILLGTSTRTSPVGESLWYAYIWKSLNNGLTWSLMAEYRNPVADSIGIIYGFAHDVANNFTIAVSICYDSWFPGNDPPKFGRILKSTDNGVTWVSKVSVDPPDGFYSIVHDTTNDVFLVSAGITIGGSSSFYLYRSTDHGENWSSVSEMVDGHLTALIHDITNDIILASYGEKIIKSSNQGDTWTDMQTLTANSYGRGFAHDTTRDILVVAMGYLGEVWVSEDVGANWNKTLDLSVMILSILYDPYGQSFFLLTADGEVYRSLSAGYTWTLEETFSLTVNPGDLPRYPSMVYNSVDHKLVAGSLQTTISGSLPAFWSRPVSQRTIPSQPSAPVVTGTTPTEDTTPTWSWTSGGSTFRYKLDDSDMTNGTTLTTINSYTPSSPLAAGAHTLYVQDVSSYYWSTSGSFEITVVIPWTAYFDNSKWTPTTGAWDTDHWDTAFTGRYEAVILTPINSWEVGFRPTKIRISHTSASPVTAVLAGSDFSEASYTSGTEVDIVVSSDITSLSVYYGSTPFTVTNIEFYG